MINDYNILNSNFNNELQEQINGTLQKGHIYKIGMPSEALLYAGIKNLPIEMASSTLEIKSSSDYIHNHPFGLISIYNLPIAIQQPIAVFNSEELYTDKKVVLTEITNNNNNFIAIIDIRKSRNQKVNEINSIISIYAKDSAVRIAKWFDSTNKNGLNLNVELCKWADIKKALCWLTNHSSDVSAVGLSTKRIANIVNKFKNVQFFENNSQKNLQGAYDKPKQQRLLIQTYQVNPAYYRARIEAMRYFANNARQEHKKYYQNGYVPYFDKGGFCNYVENRIEKQDDSPLTFTELTT